MNIDVNEIIKNMKHTDTRVKALGNGWNIKALNNYTNFEVFNDAENQIYDCPGIDNLKNIIQMLKD